MEQDPIQFPEFLKTKTVDGSEVRTRVDSLLANEQIDNYEYISADGTVALGVNDVRKGDQLIAQREASIVKDILEIKHTLFFQRTDGTPGSLSFKEIGWNEKEYRLVFSGDSNYFKSGPFVESSKDEIFKIPKNALKVIQEKLGLYK